MAMIVWSRRTFAWFLAAAGLTHLGLDDAEARKQRQKRRKKRKRRGKGSGNDGGGCNQTLCDGQCVDLGTDVNNCGVCGNACADLTCCNGECIDVTEDDTNCGECGRVCNAERGEECASGQCLVAL